VTEEVRLSTPAVDGCRVIEVQKKPGVMDPIEASVRKGARDLGIDLSRVRTGRRVEVVGAQDADLALLAWRSLANQAIEEVAIDPVEAVRFPLPAGGRQQRRTELALRELDDDGLMRLSREGLLSLNLAEMQAIQGHFRELGREPTDIELESLAQTWSVILFLH
jgi:phosphoribosylformylglycinamidine synthase